MMRKERKFSNQNQNVNIRKLSSSNVISISIIALVMLSTPLLVQGHVDTGRDYSLSLAARQRFSSITLTAHLTLGEGRQKKDVAGALIHFYTCNSAGRILKELGHSVTGRDGKATFYWSATHNGNFWFVAAYTVRTPSGKTSTVTS